VKFQWDLPSGGGAKSRGVFATFDNSASMLYVENGTREMKGE